MKKYEYTNVARNITYNATTGSYLVHAYRAGGKTQYFPTLEQAVKYRDEVDQFWYVKKLNDTKSKILDNEHKSIVESVPYPFNMFMKTGELECNYANIETYYDQVFNKLLNEKEQHVIEAKYKNHNTFEEAGEVLGITRQRVNEIIKNARYKLVYYINNPEKIDNPLAASGDNCTGNIDTTSKSSTNFIMPENDISVTTLNLSNRTTNALLYNDIYTVSLLQKYTISDLQHMKRFGKKVINELIEVLAKMSIVLNYK